MSIFGERYAESYDLFYKDKPYKKEVERILDIIEDKCDVLDVACGTGGHAYYLADYCNLFVQDASPSMYELARKKLKDKVSYLGVHRMESFQHNRKFDVILAMFSSIDYATGLEKTLDNFYKHLRKGGMVVFDFWNKEVVESEHLEVHQSEHKISFTTLNKSKQIASIDIRFGKLSETHIMHYYSITQMMRAIQEAGFSDIQVSPWTDDLWNILVIGRKGQERYVRKK